MFLLFCHSLALSTILFSESQFLPPTSAGSCLSKDLRSVYTSACLLAINIIYSLTFSCYKSNNNTCTNPAKDSSRTYIPSAVAVPLILPQMFQLANIPVRTFLKTDTTVIEHPTHMPHLTSLPLAEITGEGGRFIEHPKHIFHVASLPLAEITGKSGRTKEHPPHMRHVPSLPLAEITGEGGRITEHLTHIRHAASLPFAQVLVEIIQVIEQP